MRSSESNNYYSGTTIEQPGTRKPGFAPKRSPRDPARASDGTAKPSGGGR